MLATLNRESDEQQRVIHLATQESGSRDETGQFAVSRCVSVTKSLASTSSKDRRVINPTRDGQRLRPLVQIADHRRQR
jgi:hypothetical protein